MSIRDARKEAGLSQRQLAAEAGVSKQMIGLLEGGYRPKRGRCVGAITEVLTTHGVAVEKEKAA